MAIGLHDSVTQAGIHPVAPVALTLLATAPSMHVCNSQPVSISLSCYFALSLLAFVGVCPMCLQLTMPIWLLPVASCTLRTVMMPPAPQPAPQAQASAAAAG